jgi:hypothetical protein
MGSGKPDNMGSQLSTCIIMRNGGSPLSAPPLKLRGDGGVMIPGIDSLPCALCSSEIQRTPGLLQRPARYAMRIDHRCPHVAMTQEGLDRPDVVVGLKKMGGEGVTKGV